MRKAICCMAVLAVALAAGGCGPTMLKTKGRLVQGGEPFRPAAGEIVRVMFVPQLGEGEVVKDYYMAEFHPADGTFQVVGKDGRGMPPGKYRITIEYLKKRNDVFNGAFDEDHSPFVREINASTPELTLDLSNPQG